MSTSYLNSQTLEGTSGLFFIPTAEIQKDGQITIGTNFVNKELVSFSNYKQNAITPFITFSFLPFIEFNLKITRYIDEGVGDQALGDRTFSIRAKIFEEKEYIPALIVGLHDVLTVFGGETAIHNNALYLVGTKNLKIISNILTNISITAGYGSDILRARTHNFVGIFGGISFHLFGTIEFMNEYDGKRFNGGIRLKLLDHFTLLGGFLNYKHFSGGASFNFSL